MKPARVDLDHVQFCRYWTGGECCCDGVPDQRLLKSWDEAIAEWGERGVDLMLKYGRLETAPGGAYHFVDKRVYLS